MDLQIVNKLDIINMKNNIDRLKLSGISGEPSVPQSMQLRTSGSNEVRKNIDDLSKRMQSIEKTISASAEKPKGIPAPPQSKRVDDLENGLKELSERIRGLKPIKIPEGVKDIDIHKSDIGALKNNLDSIQSKLKGLSSRVSDVEKNKKPDIPLPEPSNIEEIRKKTEQGIASIKNIMGYVNANKDHIEELDEKISKAVELKSEPKVETETKSMPGPPPLPDKSTGRILGRINDIEDTMKELQTQINLEKKESLATQAQVAKMFKENKDRKDVSIDSSGTDREISKLTEQLNETINRSKRQEDSIENEFKIIKRDTEQMKILKETIDRLDIDGMSRNIESVKMKIARLEESIEKIDLTVINNRLDDIERKIKAQRVSIPYVIE
jgi:chromosome segregation ATPase